MSNGISFIVCCHNSTQRLRPTLAHLAAQEVPEGLAWEVVLVDNASSDDTAGFASREWPKQRDGVLRVVKEPIPGLIHARRRGWEEARHEVLSFVDDDNWLCPQWANLAVAVMHQHPEVGLCGGQIEAVCERPPPPWFEKFAHAYAVGRQGEQPNDITETRGYVWGAGLTTRKSALVELGEAGFRPMLTGRRGNALSAGEDSELCLALRKAGWRIWYEPRLKLRHFLPAGRLDWNYLRRLHRGFGASRVALNAYRVAWHLDEKPGTSRRSGSWVKEVRSTIVTLLKNHRRGLARFLFSQEGDDAILQVEDRLGFLLEMLIQRQGYDEAIQQRKDKTPVQRHGHPPSIASHTSWWVGTEKH